jgi:hypothetical protein
MKIKDLDATVGQRVHVSDSGPVGWTGTVLVADAAVLTVDRDDSGERCMVDVTRRAVQVCEDEDDDAVA